MAEECRLRDGFIQLGNHGDGLGKHEGKPKGAWHRDDDIWAWPKISAFPGKGMLRATAMLAWLDQRAQELKSFLTGQNYGSGWLATLAYPACKRHPAAMGTASTIKDFFKSSQTFESSITNPYLNFDTAKVSRELRLAEQGKENGSQNLPATDSRQLDSVEEEVTSRVSRAWQQATSEAERWLLAIDQRISNLSFLTQLPTIQSSAIQTESQIKASVMQATLRLTTARDAVQQSYEQLRTFQREHNLRRPAKLVPSQVLTFGTITLTWIVETIANSVLLRENDDLGWIGGAGAAAVIGIINVGLAVFVGRTIWPRMNHRPPISFVYIGITVIWSIILIAWNLLAAHYRDAKVAGIEGPEFVALGMMGEFPASIYSGGLFILGVMSAIIAAIAAFKMSDPYPGYAEVWHEHEQRCADYAGEIEAASEELKDLHDEASEEFNSIRIGLTQQLADQGRALTSRQAFAQRLLRYHEELEHAGRQLLATYRDHNRGTRTDPPPQHFEYPFTLPAPNTPPAPQVAVTKDDVERGDHILSNAQKLVSNAFLEGVRSFETLEALKARLPA